MIEIIFLGTCSGIPTKYRSHPAIALVRNGEILLFDCGEGTQRQLTFANLSIMKISKIFITHFHADHFAGLMALPQSMLLLNRKKPLYIYGPEGIDEIGEVILKLAGYELDFEIRFIEANEGVVCKEKNYMIKAIEVNHSIPTLAYCYEENPKRKFLVEKAKAMGLKPGPWYKKLQMGEEVLYEGKLIKPDDVTKIVKGKKIVYSGDTTYCEKLIDFAKDADLLIHEATYASNMQKKAREVMHSTCIDAAKIAKKANAKKLILTHISARYKDASKLLEEAKKIFKNTEIAKDFMKIVLK